MPEPNVYTDEQIAAACEVFENGGTYAEAAAVSGGPSEGTVAYWARTKGWVRPDDSDRLAEAQARSARARAQGQVRWAERRVQEADAAGVSAAVARQKIVDALHAGDDKLIRATAIAYGILIDKAQLLTGGATSRFEVDGRDARAGALTVFDELAARRKSA